MRNDIEVLVLCGGEGKRLRSMISDVPKPMAPIGDAPFLDFLVRSLEKQGFRNFNFLTGYKSEVIVSYFQKHFSHLHLRFTEEKTPLGTGGAIFNAMRSSPFENFLVINGDTCFNIQISSFISYWKKGTFKLALKEIDDVSRYGTVLVGQSGQVLSFTEKNSLSEGKSGLINGGIYLLDKSLLELDRSKGQFVSLENEIFPILLERGQVYSQTFQDDFIDIGIPKDYIRAQELIRKWLE